MAEDLQKVLQERAKKAELYYSKYSIGNNSRKALVYANLGSPFKPGEVVPTTGKGFTSWDIHPSYYQREAKRLGITAQQAQKASAKGKITRSGTLRDQAIRSYQDVTGKLEAQYQASRKQAQRNTATAQRVASLKSNPPNPNETILRATSSDPEIAKANAQQTAYVASLRSGGVGIAEALLNPRTTQTYFKNGQPVSKSETSINAEQFFQERGYDLSKPELIPNSIFKSEKQLKARAQASKAVKNNSEMGDLNLKANKYQKTSNETLQKRNQIRESFGFEMVPIQNPKLNASQNLEYFGPTDKRKIENFKLMDNQPLNLAGFNDMFGRNMQTGEIQRLKTVGETYSPEMQFFGEFLKGSKNTFDSYGNMITNTGNFLTGKPQQELARPPVQDQFFGALIDSAKNTFEGEGKDGRSKDPLGDFFNTQQKRIDKQGFGQVAGELTTEALFWALPVGAVAKIPKIATSFFSPTVKATKASKAFTPGGDFMKLEGKTKDVSWTDQIGAFFGPKGPKTKSQPFTSSNVPLGASLGKGPKTKGSKKTDSSNFFGGSSGTGKKFKSDDNNFFKEIKGSGSNQFLIQKTKQIPKTKKGGGKMKSYPVQLGKSKQQFFKPIPKQKQLPKLKQKQLPKQQFFKPIPLITPKTKVKVKQKQLPVVKNQFFKPIPKLTPIITPKQKPIVRTTTTTKVPTRNRSTGMFLPPIFPPFFRQGGLRNRLRNRKRPARKAYTAWNVNTKQVGSFLKGPSYKKSRSTSVFDDLDARTKRAKKEKDYDYLDFF